MNRPIFLLAVGFAAGLVPRAAYAGIDNSAVHVPGLLIVGLMLMVMIVCFSLALKVFSLLKGGELASAWQILAISFMILLIAEAVKFVDLLNIANIGETAAMLVRLVGIGTVMIGISRIKRVLS